MSGAFQILGWEVKLELVDFLAELVNAFNAPFVQNSQLQLLFQLLYPGNFIFVQHELGAFWFDVHPTQLDIQRSYLFIKAVIHFEVDGIWLELQNASLLHVRAVIDLVYFPVFPRGNFVKAQVNHIKGQISNGEQLLDQMVKDIGCEGVVAQVQNLELQITGNFL